jgi:TPR repeat protein
VDIDELRIQAAAGNTAAQTILGVSYLEGREMEVDYVEALRLLSAASRKGATRAIVHLARMYREGLGVPQDTAEAIHLYEVAARAGEFFAQIELGRAFSRGLGVTADRREAFKWYAAAASQEGRVYDSDELQEAKTFVSRSQDEHG